MNCPLFRLAISGTFQNDSLDSHMDDLNTLSLYGSTPLHYAVLGGDEETVRYLVKKGASINTANIFLETPLHWACKEGHPEVVRHLLQHKAAVTLDSEGNTPMHWAAEYDHDEVILLLLLNGDKSACRAKNEDGHTPLQVAEKNNSKKASVALKKDKGNPLPFKWRSKD